MHGPHNDSDAPGMLRVRLTRTLYAVLLIAAAIALALSGASGLRAHLLTVAALTALSVAANLTAYQLRLHATWTFDLDVGFVLVAVVIAGPLAGAIVVVVPELVHLARRGRSLWHVGLLANHVSFAAMALAGAAVLRIVSLGGMLAPVRLVIAGGAMLAANYVFARLLLLVVRDGARPLMLLRTEFVKVLPLELVTIGAAVISVLLIPDIGVLALASFTAVVAVPQLAVALILRTPSVARLSVDDAAAIYRDALADEMTMGGAERRYLHTVDALAQRRPLNGAPANPLAATKDALLVTICTERPPTQMYFTASPKAQVVLVARQWAQLTARCTPALSHAEAMHELRDSTLARDAPLALIAAGRLVCREQPLSDQIAATPRLYRAPLPRSLRQGMLPAALSRLTA